jgi:hypothetical protein
MAIPPPDTNHAYVVRPGGNGLMESVSIDELDEYLLSGEYDERLEEIEEEDTTTVIEIEQPRSNILYLPTAVSFA